MKRWARAAAVVVAVAIAAVAAVPAFGAFPGKRGTIAFVQLKSGESRLLFRQPNGAIGPSIPAWDGARFQDPSWSRWGGHLAAGIHGPNYSRIVIFTREGSFVRRIRQPQVDNGQVRDSEPAFGPRNGIVFKRSVESGKAPDLYVSGRLGRGTRQLTKKGGDQPAWSIKDQIVFVRDGDLHLVRPDGKGLKRLTGKGGSAPNWSPQGAWIAFVRNGQVYRVRRDGKYLKRLTSSGGQDPVWSTDGKRIIYGDEGRIYSTRASGGLLGVSSLVFSVAGGTAESPDEQPRP